MVLTIHIVNKKYFTIYLSQAFLIIPQLQ